MTQAEQVAQAALQAPLNTLVAVIAILCLFIVVGVGVLIWKFAPIVYKQVQEQIQNNKQQGETNAKLATIVEQNASQAKLAMQSVDNNTTEMTKQTAAIERQTSIVQLQGQNLNSYQILVSDTLSAHADKIEANTASVQAIKASIDTLSNQIRTLLEDKIACADAEERIKKLYEEILILIKQQQIKQTGTHPVVATNGEGATT
jgi:hypothetical protein